MFNLQFELHCQGSKGLFHQSVDVTFAVEGVLPMDFNVYDFQGVRANEDFELICLLFEQLPFAYFLVQVSNEGYIKRLKKELQNKPKLREKFVKRAVFIVRNAELGEAIKDCILDEFDLDDDERIFDITDLRK